ncbi:TonB-dependent receptor [Flavobacterium sp. N1719]|uniref:TonB-dependent receptor n=1 Tax=Flavobacterium sp. N1719 TaxID=2885633 RepID=UPI002222E7B8|nr:TonB-dependent receptor [Flavobacterium sp. N1719]
MRKQNLYIAVTLGVLLGSSTLRAQKQDENIGTEVVNVVKPYTPTISDAFKVKETPSLEDEETTKRETIQYNIFSFPVASTFTPAKGKAAGVDQEPKAKLYNNYATLAAGNYGNINGELFLTHTLENSDYVGVMLRHLSSQGGIKDVKLDDNFSNTGLDLTYGSKSQKMAWNADLGYQRQVYNWYGLDSNLYSGMTPEAQDAFFNSLETKNAYQTIYAGGRLQLSESAFKEASLRFTHFSDSYSSAENRFVAKPSFEFRVMDEKVKLDMVLDYLGGSFDKDYFNTTGIKYGFANFGAQPSFQINRDDFTVNLGAAFFYSSATEGGDSKFFVYPKITASYKVVGDIMVAYAGAEGNLKQNTYRDFVQENFFLSPTQVVAPTDQKYDIYFGLKGKLANAIGYNVRASYLTEDNRALFRNNIYDAGVVDPKDYALGNTFGVVYDKLNTLSLFGELKADLSKNVQFGANATINSYKTSAEQEAWNLPSIRVASTLDIAITQKWYTGGSVFFVGDRKEYKFQYNSAVLPLVPYTPEIITLKSYFDLNAHLGYKHNERMTFFLKGNNLANQNYQKWLNYPVQGIQVLLGANFKFDF